MFIKNISNFLTGNVCIRVEGFYIERFINMCISKKILLMDITREKSTIMYAKVALNDYKNLRFIAKKTKSKMKIQGKKGLPFTIHRYRKRKIFLVLFIAVITGIIISSNYIWNIEIEGNINISKHDIIQSLEDSGLQVGTSKNDMNIEEVIRKIRLNRDDIAWIGITVKGTNAMVKIKEADKAPKIIKEDEYCNIVSEKYGIITKINIQNGTANVKVGDIVQPGDVLINGYVEGQYTGIRYVHGMGDIEARVWYTKKIIEPLTQNIPVETGNIEKKYRIKFKKNQINLFKRLSKFEKYDTINEDKKIMLFSNFYLPVQIEKIINKEYVLQEKTYTKEELTIILIEKLERELLEEIKDRNSIINTNVNTYLDGELLEVELTYETIESIGIEQEI